MACARSSTLSSCTVIFIDIIINIVTVLKFVFQLAMYVLSFLEPRDLLRAAQTCRYWRILAEDNLLWREKCREAGLTDVLETLNIRRRKISPNGFIYSTWKVRSLPEDVDSRGD